MSISSISRLLCNHNTTFECMTRFSEMAIRGITDWCAWMPDGKAHSSVHNYVQNIGICTVLSIGWLSTFGACVNDNVLTPACRVWVRSEEIHSRTNNVDCICYNQSSLGTCCPRNIFPLHFCQRQSYHKYLFAISRAEKLIVFDDVSI